MLTMHTCKQPVVTVCGLGEGVIMEHKLSRAHQAWNLALVEIQDCLVSPCYLPLKFCLFGEIM